MAWTIIAEGNTENLASKVGNIDLPPGTPVRLEMDVPFPWAYTANLAGVEGIVSSKIPGQLRLIDAHAEGGSLVVFECEAIGAPVLAIIAIGVAVAIALGVTILAIRVKAPDDVMNKLIQESRNVAIAIGVIAASGIVVLNYLRR